MWEWTGFIWRRTRYTVKVKTHPSRLEASDILIYRSTKPRSSDEPNFQMKSSEKLKIFQEHTRTCEPNYVTNPSKYEYYCWQSEAACMRRHQEITSKTSNIILISVRSASNKIFISEWTYNEGCVFPCSHRVYLVMQISFRTSSTLNYHPYFQH